MNQANLSQTAFWLYGVIVGLAIRDALESAVPNILSPTATVDPFALVIRLLLFLTVTVRFYFGSVSYFTDVYGADAKFEKKSFGLDFLFGLAHFLLFYIWALSIDPARPSEWFVTILAIVLLYDVLWFFAGLDYDAHHRMKLWTAVNVGTVVVSALIYVVFFFALKSSASLAEQLAFVPIFIVSAIDVAEIVTGKPRFGEWLTSIGRTQPPTHSA